MNLYANENPLLDAVHDLFLEAGRLRECQVELTIVSGQAEIREIMMIERCVDTRVTHELLQSDHLPAGIRATLEIHATSAIGQILAAILPPFLWNPDACRRLRPWHMNM